VDIVPVARNLRVLVVDDQASMRGLTRHCLNQLNVMNIVEAASGMAAMQELGINKFDLIISDWNMDGMDGLELLKTIRANPLIKSTPFIMSTGNKDAEKVKTAIQAGVNNYVTKPFNVMTIKKKIEAVIGALT